MLTGNAGGRYHDGMPIHVTAQPGDVAPVVLLPGDPGRAERIAARLDGAACYTRNRGLLGFTGRMGGVPVSVQTTGMGAPATAIVAEELLTLGTRVLVRVGICGGVGARVRPPPSCKRGADSSRCRSRPGTLCSSFSVRGRGGWG